MLEVDEYLKLTTSKLKSAEVYLEDAECSLHTLVERLDNCLELLKEIPRDESHLGEQFNQFIPESRPTDITELQLVSG